MSEQSIAFLRSVLPARGVYSLRSPWSPERARKKGTKGRSPNHIEYADTIEELWRKMSSYSDRDVYFSAASFKDNSSAAADNIAAIRAFRLDLDKYPDVTHAVRAVLIFARDDAHLPAPLLVYSGRGVHAWWPLKEELTPAEWQPYADGLKAACAQHGLIADPTVTADPARIMRCPGTFNWKYA